MRRQLRAPQPHPHPGHQGGARSLPQSRSGASRGPSSGCYGALTRRGAHASSRRVAHRAASARRADAPSRTCSGRRGGAAPRARSSSRPPTGSTACGSTVDAPRRVTVGEEHRFTLAPATTAPERDAVRVAGPFLPWDGEWTARAAPRAGSPAGERRPRSVARALRRARRAPPRPVPRRRARAPRPRAGARGRDGGRALPRGAADRAGGAPRDAPESPLPARRRGAARRGPASRWSCSACARTAPAIPCATSTRGAGRATARRWSASTRRSTSAASAWSSTSTRRGGDEALEAALSLAAGVVAHLARGEALIDLLVVGDVVHDSSAATSASSSRRSTSSRACSRASRSPPADLRPARGRHLETPSALVVVLLGLAPRGGFRRSIRVRGAGCVVLIVGDRTAREAHGTTVALGAITRGEALPL